MLLAGGCVPYSRGGGGEDTATDTEPPEMDVMDAGDTGSEIRDAGDIAELDAADTSRARITTDASKVECGGPGFATCQGDLRCYRPGQGSDICEKRMCTVDPGCPDKCLRRCLKRCFVDGTCDNPEEECVAGNAEGARVCVPGDTDAG